MSFAKARPGDTVWNLWAKRTTPNGWLSDTEGQMRALAVLGLEIEGDPSVRAATLGRIFARIARDQFDRRRDFIEVDAIAHFWGLIGELAAAYTTANQLGFAAKAVCRRAVRYLAMDTLQTLDCQRARAAKRHSAKKRNAKRRKAVRS